MITLDMVRKALPEGFVAIEIFKDCSIQISSRNGSHFMNVENVFLKSDDEEPVLLGYDVRFYEPGGGPFGSKERWVWSSAPSWDAFLVLLKDWCSSVL